MKAFNIFLCMTMVMALLVQQGAGWWFRLGWRKRIIVVSNQTDTSQNTIITR